LLMPPTNSFRSIPLELVERIGRQLASQDICQLRLACRWHAVALRPRVFETFSIDFHADAVEETLGKLREISSSDSLASTRTRHLIINLYIPQHDGEALDRQGLKDAMVPDLSDQRFSVIVMRAEALRILIPALSTLRNVSTIKWHQGGSIRVSAIYLGLFDTILGYQNLRSFELHIFQDRTTLPIDKLRHLKSLALYLRDDESGRPYSALIPFTVANSPNLTSLDLNHSNGRWIDVQESLNLNFSRLPENGEPLPLKHLSAKEYNIKVDKTFLKHTQNLTSLCLHSVVDWRSPSPIGSSSDLSEKGRSDSEALWKDLVAANLIVEELDVDHCPPSLLQYLTLHTGLRSLKLAASAFSKKEFADAAATRFWNEILPIHAPSLESLLVTYMSHGEWLYGPNSSPLLMACTRLRELTVSVGPISISQSTESPSSMLQMDHLVPALLNEVMRNMPLLDELTISPIYPDNARSASMTYRRSPYGPGPHRKILSRQIKRALEDYIAPMNSTTALQTINICETKFTKMDFVDDDGNKRVRYNEVQPPASVRVFNFI